MSDFYSGDPSASLKDEVRFLLGDTDETDPLLSNDEINYLLVQAQQNPFRAAINGCFACIAKLSRLVDESVGDVSISLSQRKSGFESLLTSLQAQLKRYGTKVRPYVGGTRISQKEWTRQDLDRVPPYFRRTPGPYYLGQKAIGGLRFDTEPDSTS